MRIEIAGALATSETTLCRMLEAEGFTYVREDLSTNPYLELRKVDPEKYDLLCQQRFVEDKISAIVNASGNGLVVVDYCLTAEKAYLEYYLGSRKEWRDALVRQIDEGYVILYLRARPQTQLDRIKARGRDFEQGHDVRVMNNTLLAFTIVASLLVGSALAFFTLAISARVRMLREHTAASRRSARSRRA